MNIAGGRISLLDDIIRCRSTFNPHFSMKENRVIERPPVCNLAKLIKREKTNIKKLQYAQNNKEWPTWTKSSTKRQRKVRIPILKH